MNALNRLTVVFIFIVLSNAMYSQRFSGGVLLGVCASHTTGTYVDSSSLLVYENALFNRHFSKPGVNLGVFTNLYLTDRSVIEFELTYVQKGSRKIPTAKDSIDGIVYETKLGLHYIAMPIYYKYIAADWLSFYAGPNLGLLVGYKYTQNYMDFSYMYDDLSKLDFAIDLGVEFFLLKHLFLDVKYSATFFLTPIRSYHNPDTWRFGPLSKIFWQKGQCNQMFVISLKWTLFGRHYYNEME